MKSVILWDWKYLVTKIQLDALQGSMLRQSWTSSIENWTRAKETSLKKADLSWPSLLYHHDNTIITSNLTSTQKGRNYGLLPLFSVYNFVGDLRVASGSRSILQSMQGPIRGLKWSRLYE
jgi:hypothetical protein